jgi:hypothetical protein
MNDHYENEKTFILISSVLTWAETKQNVELPQDETEEEEPAGEEEEEDVEQEAFTEDMYNKRVPHVKYTAWKEVEKLCKQANSKTLHTYVIFAGMTYGEGESMLHPLFKQAWHLSPEGLPTFGTGKQLVPLVHVQDLATFVYKLASRDEPEEQRYYFGCDDGNVSWNAIIKALNDSLGNGKTYRVQERDYILYENVENFIVNLKIEATGMGGIADDEEEWVSKAGFVENVDKVVAEFKSHRNIAPLRCCILGPPAAGKTYFGKKIAQQYKLLHITVADVVREYEAQQTQLSEQLLKIKQRKKEERRKAKLEEKRRLKAEAEAERAAAKGEDDEEGDEENADPQPVVEEDDDDDDVEEGEEEEEDDEETEKIKERLNELKAILNMRIKSKVQKPEEDQDKGKGKKPKPAVKGKLKKDANPPPTPPEETKPQEAPRYTDKCLAIMYRWKLAQPMCRNQGYVLDGYPKTVQQAKLLFEEGELEVPEEGGEEEEEEPPAEGEEGEVKKVEDKLLPDKVIFLTARDEFLTERLMQITSDAEHNNPVDFQRRLDFSKANSKPSGGITSWLESVVSNAEDIREVSVREFCVDGCPLLPPPAPTSPLEEYPEDPVFKQVLEFIGDSHNYGPTPQEIEAAYLKEIEKEHERRRLVEEAEQQKLEREEADRREVETVRQEEASRLEAIQQQERQLLELRKEPLKKYLMENVIPILTQGLIEVCEVRPEDPIDYLAEWLFRHNPELAGESA